MQRRIVILEDNPADAKLMRIGVKRVDAAIDVEVIDDGKRGLEYFEGPSPPCDLVLLDLNLPIASGFEILERIKSDPSLRHIPVVILSGSSNPEDIERCYELGANSYLCKSTNIDEVFAMAEALIRYWFEYVQSPPKSLAHSSNR